ncbi:hypothetical protein [Desulfocurvus sp. DL9XJH121]
MFRDVLRGRARGFALWHMVGAVASPLLAPVYVLAALAFFDPCVERYNPDKLLFPVLFFTLVSCYGLLPEYVFTRRRIRSMGKRACLAVILPLVILGLWMLLVPGMCVRLRLGADPPRQYEAVVVSCSVPRSGPAWVEVRDAGGGSHRLNIGGRVPAPGTELVFTAREGMFGVLYDIRHVHGLRRNRSAD